MIICMYDICKCNFFFYNNVDISLSVTSLLYTQLMCQCVYLCMTNYWRLNITYMLYVSYSSMARVNKKEVCAL